MLNGQAKRTQHIAIGWPNVRNMLCPTMLQDVALKCCERLARPLNSPMSDVSDNFEREIREYSPVVHSDDTVFRFDFTLTEHQQLERIYHGHLFARNCARANLQQTKKTTQKCEKRSWSCLATRRLDHSGWPCMEIIYRLV